MGGKHYISHNPLQTRDVTCTRLKRVIWLRIDKDFPGAEIIASFLLSTMTKLLEWLLGVSVLVTAWALLTFDLLDLKLPQVYREVVWPMPVYLLVAFGCYSIATVGYRVATFNDCEEAAQELQAQIQEAKLDFKKKGLKF
ncbi:dolichol-phosphate mannosyltransferase subunit 3 [Arapaima gigas]